MKEFLRWAKLTELVSFLRQFHLLHDLVLFSLEPVQVGILFLKDFLLPCTHFIQNGLQPYGVDGPALVHVPVFGTKKMVNIAQFEQRKGDLPNPGRTFL